MKQENIDYKEILCKLLDGFYFMDHCNKEYEGLVWAYKEDCALIQVYDKEFQDICIKIKNDRDMK